MKTAQVKGKVEGTINPLQFRGVFDQKLRLDTCLAGFLPGEFDGARGEVDADHLPARLGEGDDVCARTASNVDCAAGFVLLNEVEQFRRTDACVPGGLPKIPIMEKEATEQGLHFLDRCQATTRNSQ